MAKITWKPGTLLAPVPPALISCGTVEKPNVMTVAWTGIINSEPPLTYVSIRPSRYSHELIKKSGEFVINLPTLALVTATDFCGVKSGRNVDKFKEMNLTPLPCSSVKAPQIAESPVSLECKVKEVKSFGTHDMFLAEITAVNVDDKYLDEEGKLWLEKAGLIAYVHGAYFTLGRVLGKFGFSVEKSPKKVPTKNFVPADKEVASTVPAKSEKKFARKDRNAKFSDSSNESVHFGKKPRRFKDKRQKEDRQSEISFQTEKSSSRPKKFDGKVKFEKVRDEIRQKSDAPKKKYGNNKTFKKKSGYARKA